MGLIYQRGNVWWIKYYRNGKPYYESSKSYKETRARRLLQRREGEIAKGELPGIYFDKIRFGELADALLRDYRINGKKALRKVETYSQKLSDFFGEIRVTEITTEKIERYIEKRKADGLENSSVNRELAALKRMFTLGARARKVGHVPYIPMLKESNTRKGFFEHNDFLAMRDALPSYLRSIITFGYHTGWRLNEILGLTWDKVDLKNEAVHLDPGETKSGEGRTLSLNQELLGLLRGLHVNRALGCPYVFQREGGRIKRFTRAWETATYKCGFIPSYKCKACGESTEFPKTLSGKKRVCPRCGENRFKKQGRLFHDFRRTAVRNNVRAGIPERVAMEISGHKTRSVFERYNIVSERDLQEAAKKQESYTQIQNSYNLVTIEEETVDSGGVASA